MTPSELLRAIPIYCKHQRWLHISGPPGVGKSQIAEQAVKALPGFGWYWVHGPSRPYEDWGVPVPNEKRDAISFLSPHGIPFVGSDTPDYGAICIDEASQCDNSQQKFYANLGQAREIHGRLIKPGWSIISTGNREKDRAGANRILSHLRDRFTEVTLEVSLADWCAWALTNGVPPILVAFHRFRASTGNAILAPEFDPGLPTKQPTPRSWVEGVGRLMGDFAGMPNELEQYAGAVGEGAAAEFLGFLRIYRSLPDPDVIVRDPMLVSVPNDPATCYAVAGSLAARATVDNFGNIIAYGRRMGPEYGLLIIQDVVTRDPALRKTRAYIDWVMTDGKDLVQAA